MNGRAEIARRAANRLESAADGLPPALIGFDGFIDAITRVVDFRRDMTPGGFEPIRTIPQFARRIDSAAGKSANIEIVVEEERFGGNGPLMAGALGRLGVPVTFIGAVGREDNPTLLHPLYTDFAVRCRRVLPVAAPAHTDALEFDDGKIMLGRPANVQTVTWQHLKSCVGLDELGSIVGAVRLLGIVNWTLAGGTEGIWQGLIDDILPNLAQRPRVFIDLSDPAKRTDDDLRRAMRVLSRMNTLAPVMLGLNLSEAERVARVMECPPITGELERAAADIRAAVDVECVVIHPREGAAAATATEAVWFEGPLCARPRLSTGAGDHFNAGFALARCAGLSIDECLATGCAESGAFVRDGASPNLSRLIGFLRELPGPEPAAG